MDHDVLKEMEKALEGNKSLERLTLSDRKRVTLPMEFSHHVLFGIGLNTSLSEVTLSFKPISWICLNDGRLVYVSHILCDLVGCSV